MTMLAALRRFARQLKTDIVALHYAARHPDTPWAARLLVLAVVAYACSPIDLIPDFIPVLGLLDELVLLPLGIALALRMIPAPVMEECRRRAASDASTGKRPVSRVAALVIIALWLATITLLSAWAWQWWQGWQGWHH